MRLRIIAGDLGSRYFVAPAGDTTHPMGERIRGAMFNILGGMGGVQDKTVLDAFAGSGALSFESVSRGATRAVAIDKDRAAQAIIGKNIATLGVKDKVQLVRTNCRAWSDAHPDAQFDIIFADPPYHDLQLSTVSLLTKHLKATGIMILSHSGRESVPTVNGVVVVNKRSYGDAALSIYRKEASL